MAIKKQEFYEGAALHLLARTGRLSSVSYAPPFFLLNDDLTVLLKYSTKGRSPWGFTFTPEEQLLLQGKASKAKTAIGLVCGADGVVGISYASYLSIATPRKSALHVSCYRHHGEHYEINGPDGALDRKVAPSNWQRIFDL
jgi:hypothetical protein